MDLHFYHLLELKVLFKSLLTGYIKYYFQIFYGKLNYFVRVLRTKCLCSSKMRMLKSKSPSVRVFRGGASGQNEVIRAESSRQG